MSISVLLTEFCDNVSWWQIQFFSSLSSTNVAFEFKSCTGTLKNVSNSGFDSASWQTLNHSVYMRICV